jgi:hypothetical protein
METIRWSEDGQVCYIDGKGWGTAISPIRDMEYGYPALPAILGNTEEVIKKHPLPSKWQK